MDLTALDIHSLSLLFRKVYIPLTKSVAVKAKNRDWIDTLKDFENLLEHFDGLIQEPDEQTPLSASKKANCALKPFQTTFPSMRDEYVYWQSQIVQLSHQKQWMIHQWGEATTETDSALRQVHYTLKLFRLVREPIEVFTVYPAAPPSERSISSKRVDLYVKALSGAIRAVVLQPTAKSGIHSKFVDLIKNNTHLLARWSQHVLKPKDLSKPEAEIVMSALRVWESEWANSKLDAVAKLTTQEFSDMFLATSTVLESIHTIQSIGKEINALTTMVNQIGDYFARQRLLAMIQDQLQRRIDTVDMKLLLVDRRPEFQEFIQGYQKAQKSVENEIKISIKNVLSDHTSFEGLKLLRKIIDASHSLAGTHSGVLDEFLALNQKEQLNRLSTEIRLIRKGFDVTDYLNEKETGHIDMAQRLFERRLLYHRVKVGLLFIFPKPANWDETPASIKIKDQYVELAKYLKTTEDKLHHKWFTTVQTRAARVMTKPILKKTDKGFVTTLQDTLMTIWDETRLFLQTRFQVPHVCHVLLMQKPDLVHHNRAIIAILERLSYIVENLTPFEFEVLHSNYSSVENALNLGLSHLTWPSLCLAPFIQDLLESVERFQAVAEDVALISKILEDRIAKIMDHRLLNDEPIRSSRNNSSAEDFFDMLSVKGDEFFIDIRRVVSDLPPILLQVESLVSNSQTGCSPEMQNYYDYWRDRIYQTVLASLQDRFSELSELLAKGPKALFTIRVSMSSDKGKEEVLVEPDLESIEREISNIVHHWIKRSAVVPNWKEGTCISTPVGQKSFYDRLSQEPLLKITVARDQEHCKKLVSKLRSVIDRWAACKELWQMDKAQVCKELKDTSPALWQYDEQLQYYRNYWTARIQAMEDEATICCISLQMQELKQSALEHIEEWIRQLGATWLEGTKDKLAQLEILLTHRKNIVEDHLKDGSIEIDIEMLLIEVKESWHRLGHYGIQVPNELKSKLDELSKRFYSNK